MTLDLEHTADLMKSVADNIEQFGTHVTGVFPTADHPGPSFCYTAGLAETDYPELLIIGLDLEVGHWILNQIYSRFIKGEALLEDGFVVLGALGGNGEYPVILLEASKEKTADYATVSKLRRNLVLIDRGEEPSEEPVQCLQVVYPDLKGTWPWEEGYDLDPRIQPCLLDRKEWSDGGDPSVSTLGGSED